ncbi:MAG: ferritin [Flavobacteriales bacterium]
MLSKKVQDTLNKQILLEAESSNLYLSMASWAENKGLSGTAEFLYRHSDEERLHMLKLVRYVNERGGQAKIPAIKQPATDFTSLTVLFEGLLKHEVFVSEEINHVVDICLKEKDFTTHNFMQWYVAEQIEEEATARKIMDKLHLIGNDKGGLYLFDRDLENLAGQSVATGATDKA